MHKRYYTDDQSQIQALCNMDYVLFQSYLPIYLSNMSFSYETHLAAASEKIKKTLENFPKAVTAMRAAYDAMHVHYEEKDLLNIP